MTIFFVRVLGWFLGGLSPKVSVAVEHILREAGRQIFRHVTRVMRICARFASVYRDAEFCVGSLKVTREIKVKEVVANRSTIR